VELSIVAWVRTPWVVGHGTDAVGRQIVAWTLLLARDAQAKLALIVAQCLSHPSVCLSATA